MTEPRDGVPVDNAFDGLARHGRCAMLLPKQMIDAVQCVVERSVGIVGSAGRIFDRSVGLECSI